MFLFWLTVIGLTIIALSFVSVPLLRSRKEIQGETVSVSYVAFVVIAILLVVCTFLLYFYWGNSKKVSENIEKQKNAAFVKATIEKLGSRQNIITTLRQRLEILPKAPEQAKGWFILGKLYFNEGQYQEAISAFQTAVNLKPEDADYVIQLVSSRFMLNRKLNPEDKELLNKLLTRSPNNTNAINLLALDAYQRENYAEAVHYWERLLNQFPPDSEDSKLLLEMIKQGQQHLGIASNNSMKITVHIKIASGILDDSKQDLPVFIYALSANGPKIPLAVVKTTVSKLSDSITLSDAQSMLANRKLSSAKQFYIEARISKSGNAIPAKGDKLGKSQLLSGSGQKDVTVIIDKEF